jgi:ATP-dependent exoDNAse (exonuclease V) beta subunit
MHRVFYVGLTRTKQNLFIVDAEDVTRSEQEDGFYKKHSRGKTKGVQGTILVGEMAKKKGGSMKHPANAF